MTVKRAGRRELDPHAVYCDLVDAAEQGEPVVLAHERRGMFPELAQLAVAGAQSATAQLCLPEVKTDPDVRQHLSAVIAVAEAVQRYITDAPMARAYQQVSRDLGSSALPANPAMFLPRHDIDGMPSYLGNRL